MSELFEFFLPNVDFGTGDLFTELTFERPGDTPATMKIRDKIDFELAGVQWTLRPAYAWDGGMLPADAALNQKVAQHRQHESLTKLPHCYLQVSQSQLSKEQASEMADDISWLLQGALGQKVGWDELRVRCAGAAEATLLQQRAVAIATTVSHNSPISNQGDGSLKRFLENAYPIFLQKPQWWRITLDWFAQAYETPVIQVTGLIFSMLLDRMTTFLLKGVAFEKQIDATLEAKLKEGAPERLALADTLDASLKALTAKWTPARTNAIIEKVSEWNDQPSYPAKIKRVFQDKGLPVPDGAILVHRHTLAHNGELKNGTEPGEYFRKITDIGTTLILKTLGYTGPYFALGTGQQTL